MGRRIAILSTAILAFGVLIGATSVVAQETGTDTRAVSYQVAECTSTYVENEGTYAMLLPKWCKSGRCEIFGEWGGEPVGAYGPGLTVAINFIQYPYAHTPNTWVTGPNIAVGGAVWAGGFGRNGDRNYETILGPYQTPDGSYFMLMDDSSVERKANKVSFIFDKNGNDMDYAKIFICKG